MTKEKRRREQAKLAARKQLLIRYSMVGIGVAAAGAWAILLTAGF